MMDTLLQLQQLQRAAVLVYEELTGESIDGSATQVDTRRAVLDMLETDIDFRDSVKALLLDVLPDDLSVPEPAEITEREPDMLTVQEAAALLRVNVKTIYFEIAAGRLPHRQLGRRVIRIPRAAVIAFLPSKSA